MQLMRETWQCHQEMNPKDDVILLPQEEQHKDCAWGAYATLDKGGTP